MAKFSDLCAFDKSPSLDFSIIAVFQQFIELVKFFTNKTCQKVKKSNNKSAPATVFPNA